MKNVQIFIPTQASDPIPTGTLISDKSISESAVLRPRNIPKQMKKKKKDRNQQEKNKQFPQAFP